MSLLEVCFLIGSEREKERCFPVLLKDLSFAHYVTSSQLLYKSKTRVVHGARETRILICCF